MAMRFVLSSALAVFPILHAVRASAGIDFPKNEQAKVGEAFLRGLRKGGDHKNCYAVTRRQPAQVDAGQSPRRTAGRQ